MSNSVVVQATVAKVATMADSGIRVSFDLPEFAIPQAAALMEFFRTGAVLCVEITQLNTPTIDETTPEDTDA